jgi:beta-apo-4'-carotenal oxygenase
MEKMLDIRYPPYEGKFAKFAKMTNLKPNFDRDGKVKFNPLTWLFTLGAGSASGGAVRALVVVLG